MYTIYKYHDYRNPIHVDGGQTREQVIRALIAHGLYDPRGSINDMTLAPLPRFGRELHIDRPLYDPRGSIIIRHV